MAKTYRTNKEVTLYMLAVDGVFSVTRREIEVLEEATEKKELPSLLGLEFLEELGLKLTYDMPVRAVYLER